MSAPRRFEYFPYLAIDYKAAEEWLNTQAESGWALKDFFPHPLPPR